MGAVEIRFLTVAQERHPRSVAFIDFTAKSDQERFNVCSKQICGGRRGKKSRKRFFLLIMAYSGIEW